MIDADRPGPLVLLAEDDAAVSGPLVPLLERSGFRVRLVENGLDALAAAAQPDVQLCLFDVLMPGIDGREALRRLRSRGSHVPIVLLTEAGGASERAMALEEGADDYVNKPFDPAELVARMRAVLRRVRPGTPTLAASSVLRAGELRLDRVARRAHLRDRELTLTPRGLLLLDYLLLHPDEVLTRDRLLNVLWGYDFPVGTRAVDNRVAELRKALGDDSGTPRWIETVAGAGYRFLPEVVGQVAR